MSSGAYPKHLTDWIRRQLESFLGYPDDGQLTSHLLGFASRQQLAEYTQEMLGDNKAVQEFTAELWRRKTGEKPEKDGGKQQQQANAASSMDERKTNEPPKISASAAAANAMRAKDAAVVAELGLAQNVKVKVQHGNKNASASPVTRTVCHCQATTHTLFSNCTACGKIVCSAEGEGPCFFCGSLVTQAGTFISESFAGWMKSMEPQQKGASASSSSSSSTAAALATNATTEEAARDAESAGLQKAEAQRNKLLAFSRGEVKASRIFDAQSDWYEFESNAWLSEDARAKKKAETEEAIANLDRRKAHTLTLDIENLKIVTHSSDAWRESLEPQTTEPKWTDEVPQHTTSQPHGASMAAAMGSSRQSTKLVDELKMVSHAQYFANDTLTGRAREVYTDLKQSLRAAASSAVSASSAAAVAKPSNPLLDSLRKSQVTGVTRGAGFSDSLMDGLSDGLTELQLEEQLASNRSKAGADLDRRAACAAANDEDEPTNCAGALAASCAVYPDESDRGVCLSMHQPYASLLVAGIKCFEGRGWFTPHRGRLWIASGSRETTPEEIASVEAECRLAYGPNAKIPFPKDYPTSALLGCVDMTHCWSSAEFKAYRASNGDVGEDSQSAFVFVCTNPRTIPLPQSHSGQHKIYNLSSALYQGLGPTLTPVSAKWRLSLPKHRALDSGLDLWPASVRPASVSASSLTAAVKPSVQVLQPGMLLLKQALPLNVQQSIVDCIRHIGLLGNDVGFTTPTYRDGPALNLQMLCLNMFWNVNSGKYERLNVAGKPAQAIPSSLQEHVARVLAIAVDYLQSRGAGKVLPSYVPDIAIVNYYSASKGKLGVHQDKDESAEAIKMGYPVISMSFGDTASFVYGDKRIAEEKMIGPGAEKYNQVNLTSGDVLVFGGPSRSIFHGVDKILPNTKPRDLFMRQGRLNITFRKL